MDATFLEVVEMALILMKEKIPAHFKESYSLLPDEKILAVFESSLPETMKSAWKVFKVECRLREAINDCAVELFEPLREEALELVSKNTPMLRSAMSDAAGKQMEVNNKILTFITRVKELQAFTAAHNPAPVVEAWEEVQAMIRRFDSLKKLAEDLAPELLLVRASNVFRGLGSTANEPEAREAFLLIAALLGALETRDAARMHRALEQHKKEEDKKAIASLKTSSPEEATFLQKAIKTFEWETRLALATVESNMNALNKYTNKIKEHWDDEEVYQTRYLKEAWDEAEARIHSLAAETVAAATDLPRLHSAILQYEQGHFTPCQEIVNAKIRYFDEYVRSMQTCQGVVRWQYTAHKPFKERQDEVNIYLTAAKKRNSSQFNCSKKTRSSRVVSDVAFIRHKSKSFKRSKVAHELNIGKNDDEDDNKEDNKENTNTNMLAVPPNPNSNKATSKLSLAVQSMPLGRMKRTKIGAGILDSITLNGAKFLKRSNSHGNDAVEARASLRSKKSALKELRSHLNESAFKHEASTSSTEAPRCRESIVAAVEEEVSRNRKEIKWVDFGLQQCMDMESYYQLGYENMKSGKDVNFKTMTYRSSEGIVYGMRRLRPPFILPEHWNGGTGLIDVTKSLSEMIEKKMLRTQDEICEGKMKGPTIMKVEHVRNKRLWELYQFRLSQMRQEHADLNIWCQKVEANNELFSHNCDRTLNEIYLFHGTSSTAAAAIAEEGFDNRRPVSMHGLSIDFTHSSCRAQKFPEFPDDEDKDLKTIIVARVLLGDPYHNLIGKLGNRRPECREDDDTSPYDSVITKVGGAVDYRVYDPLQTYPEYILTLRP